MAVESMTLKELDDNIKDNPDSVLAEKFRYIEKRLKCRNHALRTVAHRMNIKLDETNGYRNIKIV